MGLRELLTGAPPQTLGLDAKGFAYSQQGGSSSGVYYGSGYQLLNALERPSSREYAAVRIELSSALAVCLRTVTNAYPEAELCVERENDDGEDEREPKHPALMLIERPNPYFSGDKVLAFIVRQLMTTGNGYLVKRRGAYGKPVELWPVPSSMMRPVWPDSGEVFISGYEITIDGRRALLEERDVIHFRDDIDPDPPSYGRCGLPPLPPILQDLYIDTAAADFTAAIMKNMGLPGAIVSPKQLPDGRDVSLPKEKRDEFAAEWQRRFTGQGRGRVFFPSIPMDVHQLGFDPEKMSLKEIRQICESRVAGITRVPAIVAGFSVGLEQGTLANYGQAKEMFWDGCMVPRQRDIASTLTYQLLRVDYPNSEQLYFAYEYDHIKALQESETEKRQRDREDFLSSGLTHHQYVSRLGVVPEGDDWIVLPSSVTAYPVDAMPVAEPEPEPGPQRALPPAPEEDDAVPKGDEHASHRAIADQVAAKFRISRVDAHRFVAEAIREGKADRDLTAPLDRSETEIEDEAQPKSLIPGVSLSVTGPEWRIVQTGEASYKLEKAEPDLTAPLNRSETEIEDEAQITDDDIADATAWVAENVPALADLLDAETVKRKADDYETKASYRWNPRTRRYIGANGRMVPKAAVDAAMDAAVDVGRAEMASYADALIAGDMSLPAYQVAMEASIKRMHLAAVATTRGGWANLTPSERGKAARAIREQYQYLNKSCLAFANGDREVNGRVRATSQMYASSARAAYGELDYDAAKDAAEAQVETHQERWIRHASDSCSGCIDQASKGWVGLGELPPIGSQQCLSQCRCSKSIRKKSRRKDAE